MTGIFLFPERLVTPAAACNQGRSGGKDRDAALSHRPGTPFLRVAGVQNRVPRDRG
jgi:hypothetical protein